jgi:hypothetical protein
VPFDQIRDTMTKTDHSSKGIEHPQNSKQELQFMVDPAASFMKPADPTDRSRLGVSKGNKMQFNDLQESSETTKSQLGPRIMRRNFDA